MVFRFVIIENIIISLHYFLNLRLKQTLIQKYLFLAAGLITLPASAHGPIFSPGPETLYKDGIEIQLEYYQSKTPSETENELMLGLGYGINQDWEIAIELPYINSSENEINNTGLGDIVLETKYRLWRLNAFGKQDSISGFAKAIIKNSDNQAQTETTKNTTDYILGLAYGQESLIWQRWASLSYRFNNESDANIDSANEIYFDASIGWRAQAPQYYESDTLWMIEFNTEYQQSTEANNTSLSQNSRTEYFISPGVIWSYRNRSLKGGIQIPIYSDLNNQIKSDYRFKVALDINF
jgi:outer membrane putative beta-barrel porin/alpha-amylase